jgi:hypothetical protein
MTIGILERGTTDKEPEASPACREFYGCMRTSARNRVSDDGRRGGNGDGSISLRRGLSLSCVAGLLRDGVIGRA